MTVVCCQWNDQKKILSSRWQLNNWAWTDVGPCPDSHWDFFFNCLHTMFNVQCSIFVQIVKKTNETCLFVAQLGGRVEINPNKTKTERTPEQSNGISNSMVNNCLNYIRDVFDRLLKTKCSMFWKDNDAAIIVTWNFLLNLGIDIDIFDINNFIYST